MPGYNTVVPGFEGISLLSEREYAAIAQTFRRRRGLGHVLELGTFDGVTAARLARDFPQARIVSVDNFTEGDGERCLDHWLKNHHANNQTLIIGDMSAARRLQALFDVILVDGDHRAASVAADLHTAHEARAGAHAIIFAHDYRQPDLPHIQVAPAVDAFCEAYHWSITEIVDTMAVLKRAV
jgi:predicted O-methyltransferase YrrM